MWATIHTTSVATTAATLASVTKLPNRWDKGRSCRRITWYSHVAQVMGISVSTVVSHNGHCCSTGPKTVRNACMILSMILPPAIFKHLTP